MAKNKNRGNQQQKGTTVNTQENPETQSQQPEEETSAAPQQIDQGVQDNTSEPVADTSVNEETETASASTTETAAAAVAVTTPPVVESTEPEAPSEFEAFLQQAKGLESPHAKGLINSIERYIEEMKPGRPIDPNAGARAQYSFWKAIEHVAQNAPDEEFRRLWSILLVYFEQHKNGVFGDRHVFRFAEYWQQGEDQLLAYQRILNLIKLTCNPETRTSGLKQVDLNRSLANVFTESARQRIVGFYR